MKCENALPGYLLQLDVVVPSLQSCSNQTDKTCIVQQQQILKTIANRLGDAPLVIEFDSTSTERIKIKLCNIHELMRKKRCFG